MVSRNLRSCFVFVQTALFAGAICLAPLESLQAATITKQTMYAWDEAVGRAMSGVRQAVCDPDHLLWVDEQGHAKRSVTAGRIVAQHGVGDAMVPVPSGLIHHWRGSVLLPGARLPAVLSVLQDYEAYAETFEPAVIDSKLVKRNGDAFDYRLKFEQHGFGVTAGLVGHFHSNYTDINSKSGYSTTFASNLVELQNPGTLNEHALPASESHGYLEKLFTIVRYRQESDGVYLEIETLSLSRDLPVPIRWAATPLIQRFSRQVMTDTLAKLRDRVLENQQDVSALEPPRSRHGSR